jgi:hypothetical protein
MPFQQKLHFTPAKETATGLNFGLSTPSTLFAHLRAAQARRRISCWKRLDKVCWYDYHIAEVKKCDIIFWPFC